ncbi:MAG: sugar O-acetyltransferase, partial [Lachnospiraceae bacterium]|nr:sugar O-acetyltransferase [Lachnospiraceae bacterium]
MTELEKLDAGLEYNYDDEGVQGRKLRAIEICERLAEIPQADVSARTEVIRELFLKTGDNPSVLSGFNCDYGLHISVGDNFLANYNVTILDVAPVTIGDEVMIGPGTLISTVSHPMIPGGRRRHLGIARPVTIGNDVWIGGNVTILMGVN